jgi:hypothetical protein
VSPANPFHPGISSGGGRSGSGEAGAKKSGGKAIRLQTCHVAMLQEPEKVADLITEAAKGAAKAAAK